MRNLKISTRLVLGFGSLFALLCLIGILALTGLGRVGDQMTGMMEQRYPVVEMLTANRDDVNTVARSLRNLLLAPTDEAVVKLDGDRIQKLGNEISARADKLNQMLQDADDRAAFQKIVDARMAYRAHQTKALELIQAKSYEEARLLLFGKLREVQSAYFAAQDDMIKLQKGKMQAAGKSVEDAIASLKVWLLVVGALALLIAVGVTLWLTRSISGPINEAQNLAMAVAEGDLATTIDTKGKDELAALLHALSDMQGKLAGIVSGIRSNAQQVALASAEYRAIHPLGLVPVLVAIAGFLTLAARRRQKIVQAGVEAKSRRSHGAQPQKPPTPPTAAPPCPA